MNKTKMKIAVLAALLAGTAAGQVDLNGRVLNP